MLNFQCDKVLLIGNLKHFTETIHMESTTDHAVAGML